MPPMPPMPAIPSLPFSPHLEVTNDLHLQPFPSSSRVDTQLQQPFVPQTAHPHLQNVDPATMAATHPFVDLHRHTPQQDLAVTQHDALDSTIDMAESLRDLSRYLSISQHLSDVQYDILNTDNPDFVLVPTSIDAGCYGFTPSDTQTHGTSQSVIVSVRDCFTLNLTLLKLVLNAYHSSLRSFRSFCSTWRCRVVDSEPD